MRKAAALKRPSALLRGNRRTALRFADPQSCDPNRHASLFHETKHTQTNKGASRYGRRLRTRPRPVFRCDPRPRTRTSTRVVRARAPRRPGADGVPARREPHPRTTFHSSTSAVRPGTTAAPGRPLARAGARGVPGRGTRPSQHERCPGTRGAPPWSGQRPSTAHLRTRTKCCASTTPFMSWDDERARTPPRPCWSGGHPRTVARPSQHEIVSWDTGAPFWSDRRPGTSPRSCQSGELSQHG